jgi:hypothetical protein
MLESCGASYELETPNNSRAYAREVSEDGLLRTSRRKREAIRRGWRQLYGVMMTIIYALRQML